MFICNTICNLEFSNHFILVDQISHGISKSPMKFRANGPIDTCSPKPRNNSAIDSYIMLNMYQKENLTLQILRLQYCVIFSLKFINIPGILILVIFTITGRKQDCVCFYTLINLKLWGNKFVM